MPDQEDQEDTVVIPATDHIPIFVDPLYGTNRNQDQIPTYRDVTGLVRTQVNQLKVTEYVPDEDPDLTPTEEMKLEEKVPPEIDVQPGELEEIQELVTQKFAEMEDHLHRVALLARFVPTDFEIRESGIYARVRRDNDPGGWWVWRAIIFPTREQIIPDVIGLFDERDEALQAATTAVDQLLTEMETADTENLEKQEGETPS